MRLAIGRRWTARGASRALGLVLPALSLVGCNVQPPAAGPPPPPVVLVDVPTTDTVSDFEEFVGQTAAYRTVEVRSRVSGYLDKINFKDGDEVKENQVLFEIDPRQYAAEVARTEAAVNQAEAHYDKLTRDFNRARSLKGREVLSSQEYDQVAGDYSEAGAAVGIARANRDLAKLNLNFTRVLAPISGLASRRQVDPGNLVKADDTPLTTIVALDPIYVYFDIDERTVQKIRKMIREGKMESRQEATVPVYGALSEDSGFPHQGSIDFSENRLDPSTGTLRVRATIPNAKRPGEENKPRGLSPGMYMKVRLPVGRPHEAVLVPEKALGTDQGRKFLYVVNGKDEVEYRIVEVGSLNPGGLRAINSGLKPGERVVVSGLQRVKPKLKVDPRPAGTESSRSGAPGKARDEAKPAGEKPAEEKKPAPAS